MKTRILALCLALISFLGIAVLMLSISPIGIPVALRMLSSAIPGEITVSGAHGALLNSIYAKTLEYKHDNVNVTLHEMELHWLPLHMLTGNLDIDHLSAARVDIEILPSDSDNSPHAFDLTKLQNTLFNLVVDHIELNNIHVSPSYQTIDKLTGTVIFNEQGLRLRKIHLTQHLLDVDLQANVGPHFNPPIKIKAKETWGRDLETPTLGETRIEGNLEVLKGSQTFTGGVEAELDVLAHNIGPSFTLAAQGKADRVDYYNEFHLTLDLSYDHALGNGHAKANSVNSHIYGEPFDLRFDGLIQDYRVHWKNNTFVLGPNRISSTGYYGPGEWASDVIVSLEGYDTDLHTKLHVGQDDEHHLKLGLNSMSVRFPDQSQYHLKQSVTLLASDDGLLFDKPACLIGPASSICAENKDPNVIDIRIKNIAHQMLARYFTPRFTITGNLNATASLLLDGLKFQSLEITTLISPMEVIRGKRKPITLFETKGGEIHFALTPTLLTSTANMQFIDNDYLNWSLEVKDWNELSSAILSAEFKGSMQDWSPLRLFITDTNDFAGKVTLDLKADGKVLDPLYSGSLTLNEARLAIPSKGLILDQGKMSITPSSDNQTLDISGNLRSGEGSLSVTGTLSLEDTWPSLDVKINGDRFMLSNTNTALVYASPRLRVQTQEKLVNVTGELHIPEAKLNVKGYQSYISPSPDIILLQDEPPIRSLFFDLNTRVLLSLGDKISLKASHLDTGVEGQLNLVQTSDAPARATGQLSAVDGKYAAYGQKLNLSSAVLTFNNSPLDNPSLFIEASRHVQVTQANNSQYIFTDPTPQVKNNTIQDGIVGIRITGTVQNPKYTFYSTPPMPEADQLSYLLTGAPSSQVGAAQAAFMFAALTETSGVLGVSDTDAARLQTITRTLGVDLNIESGSHIDTDTGEAVNDTNLVVGKALRPRLYVSYTVGLLDPISMFRVRYQLSRHWALQSQTNTQGDTGGDILYGIESDGFLGID